MLRARLAYLSVLLVSSALISAGLMQAEKDHCAILGKDTLVTLGQIHLPSNTLLHTSPTPNKLLKNNRNRQTKDTKVKHMNRFANFLVILTQIVQPGEKRGKTLINNASKPAYFAVSN